MDPTITTAIVAGIGTIAGAVAWVLRALWVRLFDEKTGYVTRVVDSHLDLIETLKTNSEKSLRCLERVTALNEQQVAQGMAISSEIETGNARIEVMIGHIAKAGKVLADHLSPDDTIRDEVTRHLREVEILVQSHQRRLHREKGEEK